MTSVSIHDPGRGAPGDRGNAIVVVLGLVVAIASLALAMLTNSLHGSREAGAEVPCPKCGARLTIPKKGPEPGTTIGGFRILKLLGAAL